MTGRRRFQWQMGGWFGSVFGGSAWLIPTATILASNGQPTLALVPAGCCLLMNFVGCVLWHRRDRVRPFPALIGVLILFSIATPLTWFAVSANATPVSLAALNWPQQGMIAAMVTLICPAIIVWFCVLEYSHDGSAGASNRTG
jgi:hypothetical protein